MSALAERPRQHGVTDQSVTIRIVDSTDGTPETGVVAATSGLSLSYRRTLSAVVALTAASDLAALTTAHADGGMKHIGNGYYRIDVQDAAFATGANDVLVFGTVTGMVVIGAYVPLLPYDPYTDVVGSLTETAATGDPDTAKKLMGYVKQLVNQDVGSAGFATWPAAAAPANGVSMAEAIRYIVETQLGGLTAGLVVASGTIGATGNSATALHLTGLPFGDDELNQHLIMIRDVSASENHARWIEDWADTGDLATVATLPFTPQNSTDTYVILAVRRDMNVTKINGAALVGDGNATPWDGA